MKGKSVKQKKGRGAKLKKTKLRAEKIAQILLFLLVLTLVFVETRIIVQDSQYLALFKNLINLSASEETTNTANLSVNTIRHKTNFSQAVVWEKRRADDLYPKRDWNIKEIKLESEAALAYDLDKERILFEKNPDKQLPIASLTKLMTNLIILAHRNELKEWLKFSEEDITIEGHKDIFEENEFYSVQALIEASLISSSNEATHLLARSLEATLKGENFIDLMNKKAEELGLTHSHFSNSIGFDGDNFSTAKDLLKLVKAIIGSQRETFYLSSLPIKTIASRDGREVTLHNTNHLIGKLPGIIISKTGHTDLAKGCMLIIKKFFEDDIVLIVLGSPDRESEMSRLVNWIEAAYKFK